MSTVPIPQGATIGDAPATAATVPIPAGAAIGAPTTDATLSTAASTVAKPVPEDISDNLLDKAASAILGPEQQNAHPDFKANFVKDANGKWQVQMQYPAGQKPLYPGNYNPMPESSTDDQGNIYYRGNKIEPMAGYPVPVPGMGAGVEAIGSAAKTGAQALFQGAKSQVVKTAGKYIGWGGLGAAGGGAMFEIGKHYAASWLKKLTD